MNAGATPRLVFDCLLAGEQETTLRPSCLQVRQAEAQALAEEHGMPYFEVSAKNGTGVYEAFSALAQEAWRIRCELRAPTAAAGVATRPGADGKAECVVS